MSMLGGITVLHSDRDFSMEITDSAVCIKVHWNAQRVGDFLAHNPQLADGKPVGIIVAGVTEPFLDRTASEMPDAVLPERLDGLDYKIIGLFKSAVGLVGRYELFVQFFSGSDADDLFLAFRSDGLDEVLQPTTGDFGNE